MLLTKLSRYLYNPAKKERCVGNGKNSHPTNRIQFIFKNGGKNREKPKVIKHYG